MLNWHSSETIYGIYYEARGLLYFDQEDVRTC